MTTTPHPKARRGGRTKPRTWKRWAIASMHGDIFTFKTRAAAFSSDAWWNIGHGPVLRVTITELRRGKGGGKAK